MSAEPASTAQAALVDFLSSQGFDGSGAPARIDTHLSHVFVFETEVLKLKRAKRLDFVDYSTVERRKFYCERELEANKNWAGSLYLGVLPVYDIDGRFTTEPRESAAAPVDWLVRMRRFPEAARLDRRIAACQTTAEEMIQFADDLAEIHQQTASCINRGYASGVPALIHQIADDLISTGTNAETTTRTNEWRRAAITAFGSLTGLLGDRARQGKIKRCHGDLHAKNICYWNNRLVGYDALEFDDAMRTIDVLYDAAFPIMDCLHLQEPGLASELLNRYLARTKDYAGLPLLDLYLSLRAAVRAMAHAMAGGANGVADYLALARQLLQTHGTPALIAVGGRSGTGKTTLSRSIAPTFGAAPGSIVLRSDIVRKSLFDIEPEERLEEACYSAEIDQTVYALLFEQAQTTLEAGYTCIIDATFLDEGAREAFDDIATKVPGRVEKLWLHADPDVLRARVAARSTDASDADLTVLNSQLTRAGPSNWRTINVGGSIERSIAAMATALDCATRRAFIEHRFNPAHDV